MFTLFIFIAVLAILVLSHEFGHFIVARKNGIRVDEFGFGFPPRILGVRRYKENSRSRWKFVWGHPKDEMTGVKPTLYSFNLIPLGGFVRIKGENATEPGADDADSFLTKKVWQKASVLVAGVFMNILVAAVLLSVGYMVGLPETADSGRSLVNQSLHIVQVLPGKPADQAGFIIGDLVLQVGELSNPRLTQFQEYVYNHQDQEITVVLERNDEQIIQKITPRFMDETGQAGIGVAMAEIGLAKYPWYKAIYHGVAATGFYLKEIIIAFALLIKGIFTGSGVGEAVSGPVGVAVLTGQVARLGIVYLIQFTALLSLNLAVLNILPIPALDGGRLFFVLLGKITRRSLTPRLEQTIHAIGFVLLMLLVVVVTVKDVGVFKDSITNWLQNVF